MTVTIREFERLDIRVGRVLEAQPISGYTKILLVVVDVGSSKVQCIAGGAEFYKPDDFVGKRVIVLMNIEPKTVAGISSNAMLLAAEHKNDSKPYWLTVDEDAPVGSKIK